MPSCCGPHVSLKKTLYETVQQTTDRCQCIQCFLGGPIQYTTRTFAAADLEKTGQWLQKNNKKLYVHAPYVINLAHSKNDEMVEKGAQSLQKILDTLAATGAPENTGTVLHIGANGTIANVVKQLNDMNICAPLYLENCAGEGSKLGKNVDELRALMEGCDSRNIGLCIDTCHSFAAGMTDLRSAESIVRTFDELDCKNTIIHLNDSITEFGSKKDRHAIIGQGLIWTPQDGETHESALESFYALRDYAHNEDYDIILETPSDDLYEMDMLCTF
jgi:deoxyribonuclease-4